MSHVARDSQTAESAAPSPLDLSQPGETLDDGHSAEPRPALTLGWRLGLTAATIVIVVLGALLTWQQSSEVRRWRHDRRELLAESLAPLQSDISQAQSIDEIRQCLQAYEQAYASGHHPHHRLILVNSKRQVVALSSDQPETRLPHSLLQIAVPVVSPLLPGSSGILIAQQDASHFESEVDDLWAQGLATIGITVLCLLSGLLLANRFLVTRPLAILLRGVEQIERGYWSEFRIPGGAWEMRWLGYRFRHLGARLEQTVRRLIEAEKRAAAPSTGSFRPGAPGVGDIRSEYDGKTAELERESTRHRLEHLRQSLESGDKSRPELTSLAQRVWEIEALEADRIGDHRLRCRLENAALNILEPAAFAELERTMARMTADREEWLATLEAEILEVLADQQIAHLAIERRVKHIAGLWRKMQAKGLAAEQVQDVFAFRLIVADTADCYRALRAIHHHFEPRLLRFKDYVASPKANGYQSLHTSVRSKEGPVFEIQIRSRHMDRRAQRGSAAHWRYKRQQAAGPPAGDARLNSALAEPGTEDQGRRRRGHSE